MQRSHHSRGVRRVEIHGRKFLVLHILLGRKTKCFGSDGFDDGEGLVDANNVT